MKLLLLAFVVCSASLATAQNPVIVELFTSQGCSSCPAADKNLTQIIAHAEMNGQEVLGLSFHVDYWNYIGWRDPYSKKEFTERQKKYATILKTESVYTPQMIINGQVEFVGSDEEKCVDEINKALGQNMSYKIALTDVSRSGEKITVTYALNELPTGHIINAALVEKNISNEVPRGENAGRKLSHRNVVKAFTTSIAQKTGTLELVFPSSIKGGQLIIFMQNREWRVVGAFHKDL